MNNNYPLVDIVICAYRNKEITSQCIDSLLNLFYPNYKIILADDYSNDGSVQYIKDKYPTITVVENKKNLGTAKTRNNGIKLSKAEYIVTMDNDATLTPDWLTKMVDLMESDKRIGQANGKVLFLDDPSKIAEAGVSMLFRGKCYEIGFNEPASIEKYNKTREVLIVSTASMIIRRKVLEKIGGICDTYYYGYEDTDLSLRVNLAGYKVIYYPKAISHHMLSTTVGKTIGKKRVYYWTRNRLYIMLRTYEFKNLLRYIPVNLRFTISDSFHRPKHIYPSLVAWLWIVFNLPSIIKQRKEINNYRKVKDSQLHPLFNLD